MKMDILAILMVAFCLFAIGMFILFYIYFKKYSNEKNLSEDYKIDDSDDEQKVEIELVDISINDKDYVFDANGYKLSNYQEVDIIINDSVYNGTVTRGNYKDDLNNYSQIPTKLILKEKEDVKEKIDIVPVPEVTIPETIVNNNEEDEFIPKKKID